MRYAAKQGREARPCPTAEAGGIYGPRRDSVSILRRIGSGVRRFVGEQTDGQLGLLAVVYGAVATAALVLASRDLADR